MTSSTIIAAGAWGAICTVWAVLLVMQRRLRREGLLLTPLPATSRAGEGTWPQVCVVIAARNEATTIDSCVRHVLAQDYPCLRLLVADDRSDDDTASHVARLAEGDPRVELHRIATLPTGWLGKSHALWSATRQVDAERLLFLDADATLDPSAVRTAVAEARRRRADLLTLWPRNGARGFWEHLVIPLCGGIIALWFGSAAAGRTTRPFANGQFILIRRSLYEQIDGHRAVRDALIEDVALAERCAAAGASIVAAGGADLFSVRMYDGLRAVCDGWSRIFVGALRSPWRILLSLAWLLFGSLLPYLAAPVLIWQVLRSPSTPAWILLGLCIQHLALIHIVSYRFWRIGRCDARYLWLYPLSVIAVMVILVRAGWVLAIARTVTWRGVRYRIDRSARITLRDNREPTPKRRPARLAWATWIILAAIAGAGVRNYRVDNSLDAWLPQRRSVGPHASYAVIGWETDRVSHDQVIARLRNLPEIAAVLDLPTVRLIGPAVGLTPQNLVVSPDGSYEGLFCFRSAQANDQQFVASLHTALASLDTVAIAGPAVYATTLDRFSQQRMPLIMAAITLIGFALLWLVSGDGRAAAAGVAAITLSQIILIGGIGWLGLAMGMSLMMVPPLMMALGYSYAAHRALRRRGPRTQRLGVLALCAATTALGIGTFILTPLPPIRTFALAGVAGLALVWLATVLLIPAAAPHRRRLPGIRLALRAQRHGLLVSILAGGIALAGILLSPRLRFASDPLSFFPPDTPAVRDFATLDRRLTGMLPFQVQTTLEQPIELIASSPGVRKVIDITPTLADPRPNERTLWCLADNSSLPKLAAAAATWKQRAAACGASFEWLGVAAQLDGAEQMIRRVALGSLPAMAAVIAGILFAATRRVAIAVIGAAVAMLPVAALIAIAALLRLPLDLTSLMIGSISVGIAVDDVLHLTCAARARRSMRRAMIRCWRPCAGSSLINTACLALFALSPFAPTRQFGLLMAAAIVLAAMANHLVLPALLTWFRLVRA